MRFLLTEKRIISVKFDVMTRHQAYIESKERACRARRGEKDRIIIIKQRCDIYSDANEVFRGAVADRTEFGRFYLV